MIVKLDKKMNYYLKDSPQLVIPSELQRRIDDYWKEFIKNKDNYWDGEIFVVTNINLDNGFIEIGTTKYSSLVYAKRNNSIDIKPLFVSLLLKTKDNKYLIIKNNHDCINIIGGVADKKDFVGKNFYPDLCVKREVLEEIGIDIDNTEEVLDYNMKYLKVPANNELYYTIGILYTGDLNYTSDEFKSYLEHNKFDGEIKEYYFYSKEDCLELDLTERDISFLKEFITIENSQ